jgi:type II secretory pathway component PulM
MTALRRIFGKIANLFRWPFRYFAAEWNRMSVRERRLLSLLGGAVVACAVLVVGYLVFDSYQTLSEKNQELREAIDDIAKHSDKYRDDKARAELQQKRIGSEPTQLAADLEAAAKEAGIQIPETADRPDQAAGKHYVEHSLDVKLRKVDLKSLATFLSKVETGKTLILVTRLGIRRSFGGEGTTVDVDLTATTWERLKDSAKRPSVKGTTGGKDKT